MSFSSLSSAQLSRLIELVKEKEILQAKLERIDKALEHLDGGAAPRRRGRKPGPKSGAKSALKKARPGRRRGKRLKEPLLRALKAGGASGVTVKELAAKLKVKPGNVFSWFYTTGKKIKGISKVGEARYAFSG
jgi:hypothetical protein